MYIVYITSYVRSIYLNHVDFMTLERIISDERR